MNSFMVGYQQRAKPDTTLGDFGRSQRDEPWFYVFHYRYVIELYEDADDRVKAAKKLIARRYKSTGNSSRYRLQHYNDVILLYLEAHEPDIHGWLRAEFRSVKVTHRSGLPHDHPDVVAERERRRTEAADKAWETRRSRGDTGSDAAKKAWATRRAMGWTPKPKAKPKAKSEPKTAAEAAGYFAVRRAAANKAWATRRANGWVHPSQRK